MTRWIPALMIAAISLPVWAQSHSQARGRFPLTPHQVARTLTENGVLTLDEQVLLLAKVVATEASPEMEILSVEPLAGRFSGDHRESRSLVKLGCHSLSTCLPFYSIVTRPDGATESAAVQRRVSPTAVNATTKPNAGVIMRAGTHATLVMDDARAHVEVAVISLESGIAGHKIRVASPDHKQVYVAEVVSANLLKRSF